MTSIIPSQLLPTKMTGRVSAAEAVAAVTDKNKPAVSASTLRTAPWRGEVVPENMGVLRFIVVTASCCYCFLLLLLMVVTTYGCHYAWVMLEPDADGKQARESEDSSGFRERGAGSIARVG